GRPRGCRAPGFRGWPAGRWALLAPRFCGRTGSASLDQTSARGLTHRSEGEGESEAHKHPVIERQKVVDGRDLAALHRQDLQRSHSVDASVVAFIRGKGGAPVCPGDDHPKAAL